MSLVRPYKMAVHLVRPNQRESLWKSPRYRADRRKVGVPRAQCQPPVNGDGGRAGHGEEKVAVGRQPGDGLVGGMLLAAYGTRLGQPRRGWLCLRMPRPTGTANCQAQRPRGKSMVAEVIAAAACGARVPLGMERWGAVLEQSRFVDGRVGSGSCPRPPGGQGDHTSFTNRLYLKRLCPQQRWLRERALVG